MRASFRPAHPVLLSFFSLSGQSDGRMSTIPGHSLHPKLLWFLNTTPSLNSSAPAITDSIHKCHVGGRSAGMHPDGTKLGNNTIQPSQLNQQNVECLARVCVHGDRCTLIRVSDSPKSACAISGNNVNLIKYTP